MSCLCGNTFEAKIIYNANLRRKGMKHNYLMRFEIESELDVQPGHFLEINFIRESFAPAFVEDNGLRIKGLSSNSELIFPRALINRPISVGDVCYNRGKTEISIIYKIVGPWTLELSKSGRGDLLKVVGPLGGSVFPVLGGKEIAVLVAGGVGLPPLLFLAKKLLDSVSFERIYLLVGAGGADELPLPQDIEGNGLREFSVLDNPRLELMISTDDGSEGYRGFVTDLIASVVAENVGKSIVFYSCGPKAMMRRVAELAGKNGISCYLSFEERMACGVGACQSCVVPMKSENSSRKYSLCCSEGPVFSSDDVDWERVL